MKYKLKAAATTVVLSMGLATTAQAFEPGDCLVPTGVTNVNPKSGNLSVVSRDDAYRTHQLHLHDDRPQGS